MASYHVLIRDLHGWQAPVLDILNDPPGSPTEGQRYLINTSPTGTWVGHAGAVATYNGSGWDYAAPSEGWHVYDCNSNSRYRYSGSAWASDESTGEANTATNVGDGTGQIYKEKVGVDLKLKTIKSGTGVDVTNNTDDITLSVDNAEIDHDGLQNFVAAEHANVAYNANTGTLVITPQT